VAEKRGRKLFLSEESKDILRLTIQSLDLYDFLITTYTLKEFIVKLKVRDLGIERWTKENEENVKKPCKDTTRKIISKLQIRVRKYQKNIGVDGL
jgi:hypothetical protein